MIRRIISDHVVRMAAQYAVVSVMGPRQSGKTTLVKNLFPNYRYVNLEDPDLRYFAQNDGAGFLRDNPAPLIIDEVQRVPELLSRIQVSVDDNPRLKGRYILTGSHQPALHAAVSQSLAGRVALINLLPFSLAELRSADITLSREELIYNGFMPRIYDENAEASQLYSNYLQTYVERDVNVLVNLKDKRVFESFLRLTAGRIGQLVNYESLACELGVSAVTVKSWYSVLEASYITFTLPPYFRNFGKRFVKTPKVYFTDVGLACHLLGIGEPSQIGRDPLFGGLFENMVIADLIKARFNQGLQSDAYFLRDAKGREVDLVIENSRRLDMYEIKSAMSCHEDFTRNLDYFSTVIPDVGKRRVVYSGGRTTLHDVQFVNFADSPFA